jgi:hypothetical protein
VEVLQEDVMLYEVIVKRAGTDTSGRESSTLFRTVVEAESLNAAAIEGLQAMRRELVGPLQGPNLVVEISAMGEEHPA